MIAVSAELANLGYLEIDGTTLLHALTYTMDYFLPPHNALEHLWSLSVEEQFYIAWPFAVALTRFKTPKRILSVSLVLCPCLRCLGWLLGLGPYLVFRRFEMIADCLAAGCLLSLVAPRLPRWLQSNQAVFLAIGTILVDCQIARKVPGIPIIGISINNLCAMVIINSLCRDDLIVSRLFAWSPFVWIGQMSYSLYLWQQLFIVAHPSIKSRMFEFPYSLAALFAVASVSHYCIEKPIKKLGKRIRPDRKQLAGGAGGMSVQVEH